MAKRKVPISYGWNQFATTSREKLDTPYGSRPSERQLLDNEIGPYEQWVDKPMRQKIITAILGVTWWYIPDIVHCMVCPTCTAWGVNPILDHIPRVVKADGQDWSDYEWEPTDDQPTTKRNYHQPSLFGD